LALVDTSAWWGERAPKDWQSRGDAAAKDGLAPMVPIQLARWFTDEYRKANPEVIEAITRTFLASDVECYRSSCGMLGAMDLRETAKSLRDRDPVAIVVGEEDQATPVHMSQTLCELTPNSTLMIIPEGRHLTPMEFPKEVSEAIRDLVRRARD
jgi:3-oxoadipate enol-lactonase